MWKQVVNKLQLSFQYISNIHLLTTMIGEKSVYSFVTFEPCFKPEVWPFKLNLFSRTVNSPRHALLGFSWSVHIVGLLQYALSLATLITHDFLKVLHGTIHHNQHWNTVLRYKSLLSIVPCNITLPPKVFGKATFQELCFTKIIVEFHLWILIACQDYYCINLFVQIKVFLSGMYNKSLYDWSQGTLFKWPEQKVHSLNCCLGGASCKPQFCSIGCFLHTLCVQIDEVLIHCRCKFVERTKDIMRVRFTRNTTQTEI